MRIFLIGFMGCGKSHWGQQLAAKLAVPFFDLDQQIEAAEKRSIPRIFYEKGEEYFRERERDLLTQLCESHTTFVMATGGGTPCFFNNIDYMNSSGTTVWINCSTECLFQRLLPEKEKRPLLKNLSDEQLHAFILKKSGDRKIYYQQAAVVIYEDELSMEKLLQKIYQPETDF